MSARKRRATTSQTSPQLEPKRTRSDDSPTREVIELLDDEESMESIIARIQEQEQSEAFARQLNEELNGAPGPSSLAHEQEDDQDVIALDGEDDEALARRLAQEWEQDDDVMDVDAEGLPQPEHIVAPAPSPKGKNKEILSARSGTSSRTRSTGFNSPVTRNDTRSSAEDDLVTHRNVFVQSRPCTNCGGDVVSPRGYVRANTPITYEPY